MAWMRNAGHWPTQEERHLITPEMVADHDAMLAERWDKTVRKDDVVWVLGDLTANTKHVPMAIDWFNKRPGRKHLVLGNHDPAHPMHSESHKFEKIYYEAFESVGTMRKRHIPMADGSRQTVLLSHFPYDGDGDGREDRASQYRLRNEGLALLHGHVHSKDKVTYTDDFGDLEAVQIHVGVDAWDFTPVSLEQVAEILDR
jgi:calcineurin-like phosphoesterase family protein